MGHLNGILAREGGNLNNNFQKSQMPEGCPGGGGMLKLRFDRYIRRESESFPNVPDLRYSSLLPSPVPTRSASVLETQDSFVSLVMHLNNRNNVCDASLPRSRALFMEKALGSRGSRGNVTTFMLDSLWVSRAATVNSGIAYFRIGEYL